MRRLSIGFFLILVMGVFGFTNGGGRLGDLFHGPEMLTIFSFVVGSLVLSFGFLKPIQMKRDIFREPGDGFEGSPRTNALICECAFRSTLLGAAVAGLVRIVATMQSIGGDVSAIGYQIACAFSSVILGAAIAVSIFRPLKLRFLGRQQQWANRLDTVPARTAIADFLFMAAGIVIAIILLVAYLIKTVAYLGRVLK